MSTEERVSKLVGHAEHILDLYIGIREKYSFLEPMLYNENVCKKHGSGLKGRGFNIIRNTLLFSCIQDIANIVCNKGTKTPNISLVMDILSDDCVRYIIRSSYADWGKTFSEDYDQVLREVLERMEAEDAKKRLVDFDQKYSELILLWGEFRASEVICAIEMIRDKFTAHKELHHAGDKYKMFNVTELGLKYDDIKSIIGELEIVVNYLTLLCRNVSFSFGGLHENLYKSVDEYFDKRLTTG